MIRIHRNLHRARAGGPQWVRTQRGKVAEYLESVTLTNVTTRTRPGCMDDCKESQKRAVCAFFDGVPAVHAPEGDWQRVSFDPRVDNHFHVDGKPWNRARATQLRADGSCWVLDPVFVGKITPLLRRPVHAAFAEASQ